MAKDGDFIKEVLERWRLSEEAFRHTRERAADDLRFEAGYDEYGKSTQWETADLYQWREDGRPALTLNQLSQFTNQVINEGLQQRPTIKVHPVDSESDPLTAETLQGVIRSIEHNSNAAIAYGLGLRPAVVGGFGYWMLRTAHSYPNPQMEAEWKAQHIEIKPVRNPFLIFPDPTSEETDGSDWDFCLLIEDVLKEVYRGKYGDSEMASLSLDMWYTTGGIPGNWLTDKSVRVAEYYYAKYKKHTAYMLTTGKVVRQSVLDENVRQYGNAGLEPGVEINDEREITERTIHWAKINAIEKLEETDWQGKYIPVVPVYGSELNLDNRRILYGMVRNAKETQKAMNYMVSSAVESIGLMPKSPYIVAAGAIDRYKDIWKLANRKSFAYLPYDPISIDGHLAPAPQRQQFEPAIQAFNQMTSQFTYSLRASMGMYGPSLGEPSQERSGLAIRSQQFQGERATFHFQNNWERAIWHTGRILLDLIPKVYEDQQVLQIIGKDDQPLGIRLDSRIGPSPEDRKEAAAEGRFNIYAGRYDVTLSVEPGRGTLRQERVAQVSEILKTLPGMLPPPVVLTLAKIFFKNLDLEGAEDIVAEFKKIEEQGRGALPPQVQQQMQLMQQQIQVLTGELNKAKQKEVAKTDELESKENIEALHAELKLADIRLKAAMKLADIESKEAITLLQSQLQGIQQSIEQLREVNTPEKESVAVQ